MTKAVPLLALTLAAAVGCALAACQNHAPVRSTAPRSVVELPSNDIHGPYAPAGRQLSIALDRTLSTAGSVSGEPFTATAETTLFDARGQPLVSPGDRIEGHVAGVASGSEPQLVLSFDTAHTRLGAAPLVARVVSVQRASTPTARVERGLVASPRTPQPPEGVPVTSPPDHAVIVLPPGTGLRIELTRPLFPPGTTVRQ